MPLKGTEATFAELIRTQVTAETKKEGLSAADAKALKAMSNGLAKAIIAHFMAAAVVLPGISVSTSGGSGATTKPGKIG